MTMTTTDYLAYLEMAWQSLPYLVAAYAILTLLPKSLVRMKRFANANYEENRKKYHRCYGPDLCCHGQESKQKARKPVTRVYPKRQQQQQQQQHQGQPQHLPPVPPPVKRSNVTKIARMFESGATRQVNRVSPTLPEIRMFGASEDSMESTPTGSRKGSIASQLSVHLQHIEQSLHLWHDLEEEQPVTVAKQASRSDWHSEPMAVPVVRRSRGTSATPSTASPLSSSPEPTSPVLLRQPLDLCLKSSMEDIFQAIARSAEESNLFAGCNSLSPVTCIDDILSERRFSRPLSAYSITDLLNEEQALCVEEATYVNEILLEQPGSSEA